MKVTIIPKTLIKFTQQDGGSILINVRQIKLVSFVVIGTFVQTLDDEIYYVKETVGEVYELCQPKIICEDPNFTKK